MKTRVIYKEDNYFDFSQALLELKGGLTVTRAAWKGNVKVKGQFPDAKSKMTKPYLYMIKDKDMFPIDLSCESLFAEDWHCI